MEVGDSAPQALSTYTKLPCVREAATEDLGCLSVYIPGHKWMRAICVHVCVRGGGVCVSVRASIPEVSALSPEARKKERKTR